MASTVIVGGGIIGIATAYYLSEHQPGSSIHLVDSSATLFASASGYAGGFLARDWFHQDLASLGELSFDEHEKLAKEFNGREKWLYAKSVTLNYELPRRKPKDSTGQDWLRDGGSRVDVIEERGEVKDRNSPPWLRRIKGDALSLVDHGERTAVLDPLKLCQFLLERCRAAGVRIHNPAVVLSVGADCHDELSYVRIGYTDCSSETHIPATRTLVCTGAWTPSVLESMFPGSSINIPVVPLAGHSLVVRNPADIGDAYHSVYINMDDFSPEIYARPNGHIWLGGVNASLRLPPLATGAKPVDAPLEKLKNLARQIIRVEGDELEVIRTGLCFRPVSERGTPYITRIEDVDLRQGYRTRKGRDGGVYVATGHGPWGISLSLGTAKVMAEMMQGRELSADISKLGYWP
ncbi:related to FAD dependent oxidoreductase superfamily [Fusarium fujikuroi]|nr:related to FAD dependent oxidoreductase superfamily [Fusarium fujikuroi]